MFATQFASAIELAPFSDLNDLAHKLWKAHAAGHLDDDQAQALAEQLEARKPKRSTPPSSFRPAAVKPKRQRSPDRQASIERRRRLARASPVPPELVGHFTQGEHAVITVIAGEIQRVGFCNWCNAKIAALAGGGKTLVRNTLRKARKFGLLLSIERRRRGQKSLTNIVRVLSRSWGRWLRRIGCRKLESTTYKVQKTGPSFAVDRPQGVLIDLHGPPERARCGA